MENHNETRSNGEATDPGLQIIKYSPFQPSTKLSSSWFDLRVFYVRVSNFQVDDLAPEFLTLNHIPLGPDFLLEVNGARSSVYSHGVSSLLRRDRVDKKSEEAIFVSTDSIRLSGSVKFEVFDKEDLILSGLLEMSSSNGFIGESKSNVKRWSMNCVSEITAGTGFLKGKHVPGPESPLPTIEVYVAGCYSGTPIILTKTLQLNLRKKHNRKGMLDAIPEYEMTESEKNLSAGFDLQDICDTFFHSMWGDQILRVWQMLLMHNHTEFSLLLLLNLNYIHLQSPFKLLVPDFSNYKPENDQDYRNMYWRQTEYIEGEDGELSWFNAGVRVGVGIGLGICLGLGIGVGLLVRTYQATTGNFKRRLL